MSREELRRRFADQQRELARVQAQSDLPVVVELDLTMQQLRTLALVAYADELTAQALAAQLKVSAATVSGLLARLERRGLVRREPSVADRRAKIVLLTEQGRELLDGLDAAGTELWGRVIDELSDDEAAQLVALTERIVGILREQASRSNE